MLKDLKTSAVKRCSFAKLTLCRSASRSLTPPSLPPNTLLSLNYLALSHIV